MFDIGYLRIFLKRNSSGYVDSVNIDLLGHDFLIATLRKFEFGKNSIA